jgi:hypothetical protein
MGMSTEVEISGTGVTPTCMVDSDEEITCDFEIDAMATIGDRTVTVTTDEGTSNGVTFEVIGSDAPVFSSIAPSQGVRGAIYSVTLTGTGFDAGNATIDESCFGLVVTNTVAVSATKITATFTLDYGAALGECSLTVTTDDGTSNMIPFQPLPLAQGGYGVGRARGRR